MIEQLINDYRAIFGEFNGNVYFAPGRVNLIGEHTDYNGGHVFPCALSIGTYLLATKRQDNLLRFYSGNFKDLGIIEVDVNRLVYDQKDDWTNYPKGVMKIVQEAGYALTHGFDLYFFGNIPNGAGLSSSASIELVTSILLNDQFNLNIDQVDLVKFSQKAENKFVGVNCGIMDQFAIGMGKENHAILLDTNSLHYEYAPLEITGYSLVITNTNKRRGLADSKYNERRSECETALSILQQHAKIEALGELSNDEFNVLSHHIKDETILRRARHAVYENSRTLEAKQALTEGNLERFGQLMNDSHVSLRDDYEVTGVELDTLVALAWKQAGVLGSRMTGAGFGGCTISIVENEAVEAFKQNVSVEYKKSIGYEPTFYVVEVGDGARKLQ
jgi:galactokinase